MSKNEPDVVNNNEIIKKSGNFSYYTESYRNKFRSYCYKFKHSDVWRKKLHGLIFNDLMPILVLLDKEWPLYVWSLSLRMKFCLQMQSEYTTKKSFKTLPVPSNYPTLHDAIFQCAYNSLVAQIENYESESKGIIIRALDLKLIADQEIDGDQSDDEDEEYTLERNCILI